MPPLIPLSDRLWLNLDHVAYIAPDAEGGALVVQLASPGADGSGRRRLTGSEAERLLQELNLCRRAVRWEGDVADERWRIVEDTP